MLINFCTLFDSNYAAKGLTMYESLAKHCPSFHLYIFAFDDKLVKILEKMELPSVTVIALKDFEDEELLAVKPTRTVAEYCWTCSSSTLLYCLQHFNIDSCTYLDSDLYFFADPSVLIDEMGPEDNVLITEHRYSQKYDHSKTSGKYCVQFMTFRNNMNGLKILKWWRNACLKWCYARFEDGKFGDQKYLDDWPTRFEGVHVLKHLGGGVAPWNMQQYEFSRVNKSVIGKELLTKKSFPVIFFHFHYLYCYKKWIIREFMMTDICYEFSSSARNNLYDIYISELIRIYRKIKSVDKRIDGLAMKPLEDKWSIVCKRVVKLLFVSENHFYHWLEWK